MALPEWLQHNLNEEECRKSERDPKNRKSNNTEEEWAEKVKDLPRKVR